MHPSRRKKDDIETKARLSTFKAKQRNDYEDRVLSQQLRQLHDQTVSSLAEHWKSTMEVVNIFKGCHQTSGISPVGLVPGDDDDAEGSAGDRPGRSTPWSYFGRFSIDTWYRPEEERLKRPRTVGSRHRPTEKRETRPKTAPEVNVRDRAGPDRPETAKTDVPRTRRLDEIRRAQVLQLQAKAMTMTRSKFLDLENAGPAYNRNLEAALRRATPRLERPKSQGIHSDNSHSQEIPSGCTDSRGAPSEHPRWPSSGTERSRAKLGRHMDLRAASNEEAWDLNCVRKHMEQYGITSKKWLNRPREDNTAPSPIRVGQRSETSWQTADDDDSEDDLFSGRRSKSRSKRRQSSRKTKSHPLSPALDQERDSKRRQRAVENERYADMMSRLTHQPVRRWRHSGAPKFYIRPEERYRAEQQFLMKRYFLLQRQMNKDHDVEASILARAHTALLTTPASSKSARLKLLAALAEENATQRKTRRTLRGDEAMSNKVRAFLDNLAAFIRRTVPDDPRIEMSSQEQQNIPKTSRNDGKAPEAI